ncbi:Shedu anti-phage system protein SduA domain-containing protein [Glacieibacterium frigidum]|uniref:Shedu anti-phage system protein SduA domain-containing protein n=1 Tax=Glacieibacterium frigidum TaxID=2593303 RepID=UPI00163DD654|nr:Shedu anti-phage system protein SduA domain-containing protein [Glacieibacterium frigidum]
MGVKPDEEIARQFEALIDDPKKTENHAQKFLEEHTEFLIPSWFQNHPMAMNSVISKFPIGPRTADFAYLMSDSATWILVLVEIESPHKKIFSGSSKHVKPTSAFEEALSQTHVWKEFFEEHPAEVRESVRPILVPSGRERNPLKLRRVLIIGRSADHDGNESRRKRMSTIEEDHKVKILTYDSLLGHYRRGQGEKRCVLSPRGTGFAIKRMDVFPTRTFAFVRPENLHVPPRFIAKLEAAGYQMKEWLANKPLMFGDKWATKPEGWDDGGMIDRVYGVAIDAVQKGRLKRAAK